MWRVEAWTIEDDEEGSGYELEVTSEYASAEQAALWCWQRMEEGFQTRCYRTE